jgi:hypothetical protein
MGADVLTLGKRGGSRTFPRRPIIVQLGHHLEHVADLQALAADDERRQASTTALLASSRLTRKSSPT